MNCKICNEPVTGKRKSYCSEACYVLGRRKRNTQAVTEWRRRMKRKAIEYKGGCCSECGYDKCDAALEFHHVEPEHKDFGFGNKGHTRSWGRMQKELDKCVLVCANCHREIHAFMDV